MDYTIAILEQAHGNLKLYFDKNGNKYAVRLYNTETKEMTSKKFESIEKAQEKFNTLSASIIQWLYTEEKKREILLED